MNPSIEQLTQNNKYNRYKIAIAAAKTARDINEKLVNGKFDETPEKANIEDKNMVEVALEKLANGEYKIVD